MGNWVGDGLSWLREAQKAVVKFAAVKLIRELEVAPVEEVLVGFAASEQRIGDVDGDVDASRGYEGREEGRCGREVMAPRRLWCS